MMQVEEKRMTSTKRKLISREMSGHGQNITLDIVNQIALKFQLPQVEVRGYLVSIGYRIPEIVKTERELKSKPIPIAVDAKPIVPKEVIAGILSCAIYSSLGEGDEGYVVTTKEAFMREREAIKKIIKQFF
jgi:hypothetical protein